MAATSAKRLYWTLLIPALAVVTALVIGALIIWLTNGAFSDPIAAFNKVVEAYVGLFQGAFGGPKEWSETVRRMTPLILTGLSVAIAFKAGLFNIGASGQFIMGTVFSVAVGVNFEGLPLIIHLPLAIGAGILGGVIWGAIPGLLKVFTGAHEVITTIMLNYIASLFAAWTVYAGGTQGQTPGPLWDRTAGPISETPDVLISARIPWIFAEPYRVHWGVIIALVVAAIMWWVIYKMTLGFQIRTVGANPKAAKYAGINVKWMLVLSMMIAGGLAGLAGTIETLGLNHKFAPEFTGSAGFDGITVALLGQTNPIGVVASAFLLASMDAGASQMQFDSGVSQDIILIIQGLVLAFVAAPLIIRQIYRLKKPAGVSEETVFSSGWGK